MANTEYSLLNDKELLALVAKEVRPALREVYNRYAGNVGSFVKNWLADPMEAQDIVHETMLEVWRSAGRFQGRSTVKTWIFTIARNKSIDRNRKLSRTVLQEEEPDQVDDAPNPEAISVAFQDAERVRACLETLSAQHKSAIHLAFYEDLSYPEIAELENRPVGTIKTRIMHAKKLLMHCLGDVN